MVTFELRRRTQLWKPQKEVGENYDKQTNIQLFTKKGGRGGGMPTNGSQRLFTEMTEIEIVLF